MTPEEHAATYGGQEPSGSVTGMTARDAAMHLNGYFRTSHKDVVADAGNSPEFGEIIHEVLKDQDLTQMSLSQIEGLGDQVARKWRSTYTLSGAHKQLQDESGLF